MVACIGSSPTQGETIAGKAITTATLGMGT